MASTLAYLLVGGAICGAIKAVKGDKDGFTTSDLAFMVLWPALLAASVSQVFCEWLGRRNDTER
jgi:hypothetical protein